MICHCNVITRNDIDAAIKKVQQAGNCAKLDTVMQVLDRRLNPTNSSCFRECSEKMAAYIQNSPLNNSNKKS